MKMNAIIKEVALYVFFVACLCIVSYSHRDPTSFAFRETMYNSFVAGVHGGKKNFLSVINAGALASALRSLNGIMQWTLDRGPV